MAAIVAVIEGRDLLEFVRVIAAGAEVLERSSRRPPGWLIDLAAAAYRASVGQGGTTVVGVRDGLHDGLVDELLIDRQRVAELLGCSVRQVGRLVASGALPVVRIGGAPRYRKADVLAFVDSLVAAPLASRITTKETAA